MSQQYNTPRSTEKTNTGESYEPQTYGSSSPRGTTLSERSGDATGTGLRPAGPNDAMTENENDNGHGSLFRDTEGLRQRWESVQVGFVDNPREAVGEAEQLVSSAISELGNRFRQQREILETSWSEGHDPSTDDLRAAFQSYRDFFGRLLQV
jgi:hypothetical protein